MPCNEFGGWGLEAGDWENLASNMSSPQSLAPSPLFPVSWETIAPNMFSILDRPQEPWASAQRLMKDPLALDLHETLRSNARIDSSTTRPTG